MTGLELAGVVLLIVMLLALGWFVYYLLDELEISERNIKDLKYFVSQNGRHDLVEKFEKFYEKKSQRRGIPGMRWPK